MLLLCRTQDSIPNRDGGPPDVVPRTAVGKVYSRQQERPHLSYHRPALVRGAIVLFATLGWSPLQRAQDRQSGPAASSAQDTDAKLCDGCHDADAHGVATGPGACGQPGCRRRSVQSLRNVILKGIPSAGMPAFSLPDTTVDALVELLKSLNAPAVDSSVSGDKAAGKEFFFGAGKCTSC
jgi:hypothetical protein